MRNEITITESASKQILYLINKENKSDLYFRIKVDGGGCAGFQYNFTFTNTKDRQDLVLLQNDIISSVLGIFFIFILSGCTPQEINIEL